MIRTDLLTEELLDRRFDALSAPLKDALTSDRNLSIVDQICDKNAIADEEKRLIIRQITGLVILGIVHYYDTGAELNGSLFLNNPKLSNAIADELNAKIFNPLKDDLEKNFYPLTPPLEVKAEKIVPPPPAKILDIKPDISSPAAKPVQAVPPTATPPAQTPPPPAPASKFPTVGWSRQTPEQPTVKLNKISSPQATTPKPAAPQPQTAPTKPSTPATPVGPLGEFERISIEKKVMTPPKFGPASGAPIAPTIPSPTTKQNSSEPAPVIIHEDASFKPGAQPQNFQLRSTVDHFDLKNIPTPSNAVKPAVLELGKLATPAEKPTQTKMVHYTEYNKAAVSPAPSNAASQGPRRVTEITEITPTQAAAPQKPTPSKPPTPQSVTNLETPRPVIHKDYSEEKIAPKSPVPPAPPTPPKPPVPPTK